MGCEIDTGTFQGEPCYFNGEIAPGNPPPSVTINIESKEEQNCNSESLKTATINISGELVVGTADDKIRSREALIEQFSEACGDFSGGGETFSGARVQSFEINASNYLSSIPYSAVLNWVDTSGNSSSQVANKVDSIQASETETTITITHTVSATGSPPSDCKECDCTSGSAESYVNSKISGNYPQPRTIYIPDVDACVETITESDPGTCFYSKTKTWTFDKSQLFSAKQDDLKHTECEEEQTDQNGLVTNVISGSVQVREKSGCNQNCAQLSQQVKQKVDSAVSDAISRFDSNSTPIVSKSFSEGASPSGSYTVTIPPEEPNTSGEDTKEDVSYTVSFSGDGVGTVSVSGSVTRLSLGDGQKTISKKCLCEDFEIETSKYESKAQEYYDDIKDKLGDALENLAGPCKEEDTKLTKQSSDEEDCDENGSISFSMNFTDKDETSVQWNWSVDLTRPIEQVAITPTLGGGYCVVRTGAYKGGSVNVSGEQTQQCPDEENDVDPDSLALGLAKQAAGESMDLKEGKQGCEITVDGDTSKKLSFNKQYVYETEEEAPPRNISIEDLNKEDQS